MSPFGIGMALVQPSLKIVGALPSPGVKVAMPLPSSVKVS